MEIPEIGIIGFGRFGRFMAKHLKQYTNIYISSRTNYTKKAQKLGVKYVDIDELCKKRIILLAMPMDKLDVVLHQIKDKLQPNSIVIDTCSLKMFACESMKKILPKHVEIIGTHPLFGPESAPNSIEGMRIALCNVRSSHFNKIEQFCKNKLKLNTFITTPKKHDKQIAYSQALTHFVGQIVKKMEIPDLELGTKTYDDLLDISTIIRNNTKALFENMQTMNPYAKEVRDMFVNESTQLNNYLTKLNK